jgi:uncharacterized iron-regulated membrane protein
MADGWLLWCGGAFALLLTLLLALAGMPLVGMFLGAVVWLSTRRAVKPDVRQEVDETLRSASDRLPFVDRRPTGGR